MISPWIARAQQNLVRHSLDQEYIIRNETEADNNCFFHALVDQLTRFQGEEANRPLNHLDVRQRLVDFARINTHILLQNDTLLNFLKAEESRDKQGRDFTTIWYDYLTKMRKKGTWATELIVMVAAIYFRKNIKVIKDDFVWLVNGGPQATDPPMVMVNIGDEHFQSVHPRE